MIVPCGILNFAGVLNSSLKYHPLISAASPVGFSNSMKSTAGGSVWVSTSLITTAGVETGGSSAPGDPPIRELDRQLPGSLRSRSIAFRTGTRENPEPSAVVGHGVLSL